jgi:glucose uptake protein
MGAGLSFQDNLMITGRRQIAYGVLAGAVFNLANMLLVAAIAVAGLAVAFPVGIGLAMIIGVIWNYLLKPQGNPVFLFTGAAFVLGAIVVDAYAFRAHELRLAAAAGKKRAPITVKGIWLSIISGILMGSFYPLVQLGKEGELGLGPYAIGFVFALGVFITTFFYNVYFMNLPVQGQPVKLAQYWRGTLRQHALGIAGGAIWCVGAISNFAAASAPETVNVGPAISYALGQGATMISALWGLLLWKEFAGANFQVRTLLCVMFALFLLGLTLVSIAPLK